MTIKEAISRFKIANPSVKLSHDQIIDALTRLDTFVKINVIDLHEGVGVDFNGYTPDSDESTVLLVCPPYDDIYIDWLGIQNDLLVRDYNKYNKAAEAYDVKLRAYTAYYNRTHLPLEGKIKLF